MADATVLACLSGRLLAIDIGDVRPGDVVFLGGHLVRRALTPSQPSAGNDSWVAFAGLSLDEPSDGPPARGWFGRPAGTSVLVLRPLSTDPMTSCVITH